MMHIDVDATLTELPINVAPLIDDTDFKTREESLTYDQAGLDLVWQFTTTAGVTTQTAVTPTTGGGDYDWTNQGNGMYTLGMPASGGASLNNDTEGHGQFIGYATGVLPWVSPIFCFRAAGINDKLIDSAYSATRGLSGTALPDAISDAAGGLPISDVGGLDLDAKLANTNEITAARMGALTDWIDGGRLDLIIDAILADTNELQSDDIPGSLTSIDGKIDTIDGIVDSILVDTGTTIPADLATIAGYLDTEIAAILADTNAILLDTNELQSDDVPGLISALNNISAADVNAQVLDVMNVDTHAEPGQGAPGATISIFGKINYLYKAWRNKKVQDATTYELYDDAGTTVDQKAADSDDGTDATVGEIISGP